MLSYMNKEEKNMKKITFLIFAAAILFAGCSEKADRESKELAAEAAVKAFDGEAKGSTAVVDDTKKAVKSVKEEAAKADKES